MKVRLNFQKCRFDFIPPSCIIKIVCSCCVHNKFEYGVSWFHSSEVLLCYAFRLASKQNELRPYYLFWFIFFSAIWCQLKE